MKIFWWILLGTAFALAITTNPNLVLGKTVYFAEPDSLAPNDSATILTDGSVARYIGGKKNIAVHVGEGASKIFVTLELNTLGAVAWGNISSAYKQTVTVMKRFAILTSANSTNGFDGDWDSAYVETENLVHARGVYADFAEKSWLRIVTDANYESIGEVGVYDVSDGVDDTWFFLGTSITATCMKYQDADTTPTFAKIIHEKFPEYYPAMIRGGISWLTRADVANHISEYLKYAGDAHFWAIEMGTNDAWGWNGGTDAERLSRFVTNMQTIIDSAKAHGIEPIIARRVRRERRILLWTLLF